MKKTKLFGLLAMALSVGFVACNNNSDSTATTDSTTITTDTTTTTATTSSSSNNYTALADSFRTNSEAGNYLDPKTGKSLKIKYDPQTRRAVNETTGEPVWRYVDKRTWWVYGGDNWDTLGTARMEGNKLMYRADNDKWESYDQRWKTEDEKMMSDWKSQNGDSMNMSSEGSDKMKMKTEDGKVKVEKTGEVKMKANDGSKVKMEKGGTKVKND